MKKLWAMGLCDSDGNNVALVETEPRYIWLRLDDYNPDVNDALKSELPGPARWKKLKGVWVFPKHWDTCVGARKVANKFGADLRMTSALSEWGTIEKARQATIPDVNSKDIVDLPRVRAEAPAIWKLMTEGDPKKGYPPRPYQTVGAAFAARNRSCLIADDPGLGKTVQAIAGIIESGVTGPILVVAPKAAATITWPKELKRWLPNDSVYVLSADVTAEDRDKMVKQLFDEPSEARTWLITSPNYIRCRADVDEWGHMTKPRTINPVREAVIELFVHEWSSIIVDESHQTLAGGSPGVGKQKWSAQRFGLSALLVHHEGLRIALSGTPFRGKECYLWGQLNWLRPDLFRAYWKWVEKHFAVDKDGFGWSVAAMVDEAGMYAEARNVMVRRTKGEVAKDLPPKLYGGWPLDAEDDDSPVAVWLPMGAKQAKAYNSLVKDAAVDLDGGMLLTNGILAELTRLRQFAGSYGRMNGDHFTPTLPSNKFDWLVEFLDERGIAKSLEPHAPKIVVASQFSQLIDVIVNGLNEIGVKAYKFTGATSNKDRAAIEDDWQNNDGSEYRVLCLTTTAGGVSLTLDAADDLVLFDETASPDDQTQVEDRIHRLSRIHQVTIWKLFSLNTLEEGLMRKNLTTEASIRSIIDGQRGVDFFKHVLLGGKVAA